MGDAASEARASSAPPNLARKRRSSERRRAANAKTTSSSASVSTSAPPSSTSSTSPSPSPSPTESHSKDSLPTAPPSDRSSSPASTTDPTPSSSSTKPQRRRSSSTKDTNTTPTRDTARLASGATGDLKSVLKQAERAKSLFDLRRAFYQGEDIPATTLKDFNTAIRTRLGALTCTGGETLASCATRGLGAIRKAFDLQTVLDAIAGPLSPDESTKFAASGLTKYTEATGHAAASKLISQISALQTKARGGAGKDNRGDADTDLGVTSGVPSAFETKVPPNITEIKDPGGFDKLILAYVRGEIKAVLVEEKTKTAKSTSSRNSKSGTSQSAAEKKDAKSRSRSSLPSTTPFTKDKADGKGGKKLAPSEPATTTPAESTTGNASSKRRSSRSRSSSSQGGASGVESSKRSASGS